MAPGCLFYQMISVALGPMFVALTWFGNTAYFSSANALTEKQRKLCQKAPLSHFQGRLARFAVISDSSGPQVNVCILPPAEAPSLQATKEKRKP